MDQFTININSNRITVLPVASVKELFNICMNKKFIGYIDISVVGPTIRQGILSLAEENALREMIRNKERLNN